MVELFTLKDALVQWKKQSEVVHLADLLIHLRKDIMYWLPNFSDFCIFCWFITPADVLLWYMCQRYESR
jgi:hypothetical protein